MLRVRVLGDLVVERDGVPLTPPRRRPARALLGWLALHPGVHARSTVAGRLWPNVLDESARTSLRTSLSALRAVVGEEALPANREHIGLADDVVVDWREFERMLAANRRLDAVELSGGELLAGLDDDSC
jgi:DNA-binding SARP family transcriptional activator